MKKKLKDICIIAIVYILVHGFMLILTGTFWDDWTSFFMNYSAKNLEGFESGRPYYSLAIEMVWWIPKYGYRKLSFLLYFLIYVLTYLFLKRELEYFDHKYANGALIITLINIALPINDARVILANFPYTLGLSLFFAGLLLFSHFVEWEMTLKSLPMRLLTLLTFFLSFTLNSNLLMFGLVYLMIIFHKKKIVEMLKCSDFIVLPFVFWIVTHVCFPTSGSYENYNSISFESLIDGVKLLPMCSYTTFRMILDKLWEIKYSVIFAVIAVVVVILIDVITHRFKKIEGFEITRLYLFLTGLILYLAAIFSYNAVRVDDHLNINGVSGRDSMQLGLGCAMMLYSVFNKYIRKYTSVAIIAMGMVAFNCQYTLYQADWYRQVAFQIDVQKYDELKEGGNYIIRPDSTSRVGADRYYSWIGNVASVTGEQNIFVVDELFPMAIFSDTESKETLKNHNGVMEDYDVHYERLDGYLDYHFNNLSIAGTAKLKLQEMFLKDKYFTTLDNMGELVITKAE